MLAGGGLWQGPSFNMVLKPIFIEVLLWWPHQIRSTYAQSSRYVCECVCENCYHIRYTFDYAGECWAMMKSPLNEDASSIAVIWRRDAFVTYLHNLNCWTSCHHFVGYFQQAPFRFGFRLHEGDLGEQATASSIFIIFKPNLSNLSSVCVCLRVTHRVKQQVTQGPSYLWQWPALLRSNANARGRGQEPKQIFETWTHISPSFRWTGKHAR